jgi:stearoyl-CoA desaturase (delta-9 desaturase)
MPFALFDVPWWGWILFVLLSTHITIAAVTIYLHRQQAHHALELHPVVSHFFRFWLWLSTGMVTREWVAVHRKHHARCETGDDPHSPQVHGLRRVLLEGSELYRVEAGRDATVVAYGHATPDDWIERHLYRRHPMAGVGLMLLIDVVCFGAIGLTLWAIQMLWIPLFAAGVINGLGHYWGYRSFATRDASRNILPWGILIGGEELHNNHHAYSRSARLSNPNCWWEFDIGWLYIRLLSFLHLAKVLCLAPKLRVGYAKSQCDAMTLEAIITHRFAVLAKYAQALEQSAIAEARILRSHLPALPEQHLRAALKRWLQKESTELSEAERAALDQALQASHFLHTVLVMRQQLVSVWQCSTATREQLIEQLEAWCVSAEASGIRPLRDFSRQLRSYG